jgi:hypothetical protein
MTGGGGPLEPRARLDERLGALRLDQLAAEIVLRFGVPRLGAGAQLRVGRLGRLAARRCGGSLRGGRSSSREEAGGENASTAG